MWQAVLFDLDGTLTDPKIGITKAVAYALAQFGITVEALDDLCPFIGPPLGESFQTLYHFDEAQVQEAIAQYRVYFSATGIYENELYSGIPQLLAQLQQQGRTIILATSKPTVYARAILEHFQIAPYFHFVSGSELDGTRTKKAEVITHALQQCGIADTATAVMVGDREHDIIGAAATGLASVGVCWGYGSRTELTEASAGRVVDTVAELAAILLRSCF